MLSCLITLSSQSQPGRHFIAIDWTNNIYQPHTVVIERFRSDQFVDRDQPDASFEASIPAAEAGAIFDSPGRRKTCYDSPVGYKWVSVFLSLLRDWNKDERSLLMWYVHRSCRFGDLLECLAVAREHFLMFG
jgi:hypothetical protein